MGVETALEKYGTLKLSQVIDPAIKQAEQGVKVNWATAQYIDENVTKLENNQAAAKVFVPNGKPLEEGDTLVQPDLAKTLKLIKKQGSNAFYKGEIGEALTKEVQKREGTMTTEDLENYVVKEREPIRSEYRGFEVVGCSFTKLRQFDRSTNPEAYGRITMYKRWGRTHLSIFII